LVPKVGAEIFLVVIQRMKADGLRPTAIAAQLGIARSSVYRLLEEA
jgi:DNA-binding IclR family transcriptional regulator